MSKSATKLRAIPIRVKATAMAYRGETDSRRLPDKVAL
jgi:hypothetical protein